LGPPDGFGEFENETWACESSTAEAIHGTKPEKRRSAFYHGFDEWRKKLCASASRYYNTCFEIVRANRAEHDGANPAEFAMAVTAKDLSTFLRLSSLEGKQGTREIGLNGRVREFVRNVCLNYPDFQLLEAEKREASLLPRWPWGRTLGALIARGPRTPADGDESTTLTLEESEQFILGAEETLIKDLRRAIAHVHRIALVDLGRVGGQLTGSSTNERESRIRPLLERKGWSTNDWAVDSGLDFHTVSDYLEGKTRPYANTRTKLAKSLGIDITELPR